MTRLKCSFEFLTFLSALFLLSGCVSFSDLEKAQTKLNENSKTRRVFQNEREALRATSRSCTPIVGEKIDVVIEDRDPILLQNARYKRNGYFKVLCFDKKSGDKKLKITGIRAGGGMGKAFFLKPVVSVYNKKGALVVQSLKNKRAKTSLWSGHLKESIDISNLKNGSYYIMIKGDNTSAGEPIGSYIQSSGYASVRVLMFTLPTGKAKILISKK